MEKTLGQTLERLQTEGKGHYHLVVNVDENNTFQSRKLESVMYKIVKAFEHLPIRYMGVNDMHEMVIINL